MSKLCTLNPQPLKQQQHPHRLRSAAAPLQHLRNLTQTRWHFVHVLQLDSQLTPSILHLWMLVDLMQYNWRTCARALIAKRRISVCPRFTHIRFLKAKAARMHTTVQKTVKPLSISFCSPRFNHLLDVDFSPFLFFVFKTLLQRWSKNTGSCVGIGFVAVLFFFYLQIMGFDKFRAWDIVL